MCKILFQDRIVTGIFPPLHQDGSSDVHSSVGVWVSAMPRIKSNKNTKWEEFLDSRSTFSPYQEYDWMYIRSQTMPSKWEVKNIVFSWGLLEQVKLARVSSSLWILDNRGRVKYGNYQSQVNCVLIGYLSSKTKFQESATLDKKLDYCWVRKESHLWPFFKIILPKRLCTILSRTNCIYWKPKQFIFLFDFLFIDIPCLLM